MLHFAFTKYSFPERNLFTPFLEWTTKILVNGLQLERCRVYKTTHSLHRFHWDFWLKVHFTRENKTQQVSSFSRYWSSSLFYLFFQHFQWIKLLFFSFSSFYDPIYSIKSVIHRMLIKKMVEHLFAIIIALLYLIEVWWERGELGSNFFRYSKN